MIPVERVAGERERKPVLVVRVQGQPGDLTELREVLVAGERQQRVLNAKAQARGVSFEEIERNAFAATSIKDYVTAEQLADYLVFLASPRAATISGQALSVCGDTNMLS